MRRIISSSSRSANANGSYKQQRTFKILSSSASKLAGWLSSQFFLAGLWTPKENNEKKQILHQLFVISRGIFLLTKTIFLLNKNLIEHNAKEENKNPSKSVKILKKMYRKVNFVSMLCHLRKEWDSKLPKLYKRDHINFTNSVYNVYESKCCIVCEHQVHGTIFVLLTVITLVES